MPKLSGIDWTEVAKGDQVPEGTYIARIDKVEPKDSREGNPLWKVRFVLQEAPVTGRVLAENFSLSRKALWRLRMLALAVGIELAGVEDLDSDSFEGQEIVLTVTHEMYEGTLRARTGNYKPAR